ncbi:MAG: SusC/RagA family TonB-linked outer membrane protein [Mangrovibacterium sp.]
MGLQQQITISGNVTDSSGTPLPGVSIVIKGTTYGVITDNNGNYIIRKVSSDAVLIFSFVGMKMQEIPVDGKSSLDVVMAEDAIGIEEVVAIGYGTVKKVDLTGSVSAISSEVFQEQVNQSLNDALKGRFAGVQITSNDGAPGGSTRIRIRGTNTISGSGEPLYVIDGVPVISENYVQDNWGSTESNPMAYVNPSEVESVQVLKDASSTAIYGSRGSNGVILIKTKGGSKQKMVVSLDAKYGVSEMSRKYDMMNTQEYAYFRHYRQYGVEEWEDWESYADSTSTDWQDLLSQRGEVQDYNLSIRGSDANTTYSANVGWFDQQGVIISSDFNRVSGRLNLTQKVSDRLKLTTNVSYGETESNGVFAGMVGTGLLNWNLRYPPIVEPYDATGALNYNEDNEENMPVNPLVQASSTKKLDERERFFGKMELAYTFAKNLTLSSSYAVDNLNSSLSIFWPVTSNTGINFNGQALRNETNINHWVQDNLLNFNKRFSDKHIIDAILGTSLEKTTIKVFSAQAFDFPLAQLNTDYLESASEGSIPISRLTEESLASFFTRINYNFEQRYYLTASIRADGSSHFGKNNKWGYFPSGAFKWRIKEENFLKNFETLSDLALRLSFGVTGNQAIPPYQTLAASNSVRTYFSDQGNLGLITTRSENPDLKWESTYQYNAGLDLNFVNNRIVLNVDAYYKKTDNMLLMKPMPRYTGFTSKMDNIGSIENKGLEFSLNSVTIDKAFKWDTQFNIAFNRNKVLSLGGPDYLILDPRYNTNITDELILEVGKPIAQWYGYIAEGVYKSWEEIQESGVTNSLAIPYKEDANGNPVFGHDNLSPGMIRYKDISGPDGKPDGIIDSNDRTVIGCGLPDFTGSITNNFAYRNLSLGVTFTYSYGAENFDANLIAITNFSQLDNKLAESTDFFIIENPTDNANRVFDNLDAKYQSAYFADQFINTSRYISDASFIRLANVALAYNLPTKLTRRMGIKNAKLFLTGNNLYVWTRYTGYDPEVATGQVFVTGGSSKNLAPGLDHGSYPASRSISLGLNVTF